MFPIRILTKGGSVIRLTEERWMHICMAHPEMRNYLKEIMETVTEPEFIYQGNKNEMLACKYNEKIHKFVMVIYKEGADGFVITSYLSRKNIKNKKQIWP